MTRSELKQKMILCISTLQKLSGCAPTAAELYRALGDEYKDVLRDYVKETNVRAAAA